MLATVGGTLTLLLGLLLLLLPLLATELSRPRDSVWGAVVLLLGLVLVTSADRLTGSPMLAVLCGGLLIGRLSSEVGLGRWRQLMDEERQLLVSSERWNRSVQQLTASFSTLLTQASVLVSNLGGRLPSRPQGPTNSKRWVRPELPETASPQKPASREEPQEGMEPAALTEEPAVQAPPSPPSSDASAAAEPATAVVRDFAEISALLAAAPAPEGETSEAG
ncbi:MAG: Ycf66 family protein [Synechococcaceae cyanobacterium ELA182]